MYQFYWKGSDIERDIKNRTWMNIFLPVERCLRASDHKRPLSLVGVCAPSFLSANKRCFDGYEQTL